VIHATHGKQELYIRPEAITYIEPRFLPFPGPDEPARDVEQKLGDREGNIRIEKTHIPPQPTMEQREVGSTVHFLAGTLVHVDQTVAELRKLLKS